MAIATIEVRTMRRPCEVNVTLPYTPWIEKGIDIGMHKGFVLGCGEEGYPEEGYSMVFVVELLNGHVITPAVSTVRFTDTDNGVIK